MPLLIVRNDITKMQVDAIVNAANSSLSAGGGVCGCIHKAAGEELLQECLSLGGCEVGDAKVTRGYALPAKYVIHTVGPVWNNGLSGEESALRSSYRRSLEEAYRLGCGTVAFPLISSGIFGYPVKDAVSVARSEISRFLGECDMDMTVYLVLFDSVSVAIGEELLLDIRRFIDDTYAMQVNMEDRRRAFSAAHLCHRHAKGKAPTATSDEAASAPSLTDMIKNMDESFSVMLLRLIDERGITDTACYKGANIDRKLFSKIRSDPFYRPSKTTVLAFAVSLRLSLTETSALLASAGFALSRSSRADIIVEYFISRKKYDIFEINEALFSFDEPLLGSIR